jgi:transcriptional regulator with XRE-family HTH domain
MTGATDHGLASSPATDQDTGVSTPLGVPTPRGEPAPALAFSPARLRAWRHARTVDHLALAQAAGVTVDQVAACEDGQADPTPGMITAWSARLGCRPDQLRSATPDAPTEYWRAANEFMPPMSPEDLAVVARVFARNAHHTTSHGADPPGDG